MFRRLHKEYVNSFNPNVADDYIHMEKLRCLRNYLDSKGFKMPKPKWTYDTDNVKTWRFLPGRIIRDSNKTIVRYKPYINPEFSYKNLL